VNECFDAFVLLSLPIRYDFSKIGEEQTPEDAEDGPPELLVSGTAAHRR
jgi:hypothetical protein